MNTHLPTCVFGAWTVTALRNSVLDELKKDSESDVFRMFFYAITGRGYTEIRKAVSNWRHSSQHRSVIAYVGTDHAITEPAALELMLSDDVEVRMMTTYSGVYHPKVLWLSGKKNNIVWVGSNNLTKDGLLNNIEFAVVVKAKNTPVELKKWVNAVESGSTMITPELLKSYHTERQNHEGKRVKANATTFTWSRKKEPQGKKKPAVSAGSLIIEIMPKETGLDGTQIQLPIKAAEEFFDLARVGTSKSILLSPEGRKESRKLTMTVFANNTVRLSISDLEYGDRPCLVVFKKRKLNRFSYEIVPQNIFPTQYKDLLSRCTEQTREGSRRWTII